MTCISEKLYPEIWVKLGLHENYISFRYIRHDLDILLMNSAKFCEQYAGLSIKWAWSQH